MGHLKDRLIRRMEEYFGDDERRIRHALRVTEYAEQILEYEGEVDRDIVIAAAILHDIGIHEAERKHGSAAGKYQEVEGPPIAREIMSQEGLPGEIIEEVCRIIAHHHTPGVVDTPEFRVLYDADLIVNLEDREIDRDKFLTEGGSKVSRGKKYAT